MFRCTFRHYRAPLVFALILTVAAGSRPAPARAELESGMAAPNFELSALDKTSLVLNKVQGYRLLVLVRGGARLTSETMVLCRRLGARLTAPKQPWQPILIWEGSLPADTETTSMTPGKVWRVAHDPEASVAQAYQSIASPTFYLVNPAGEIMHVFTGCPPALERQLLGILAATLEAEPLPAPGTECASQREHAALYFDLGRAMADYGSWRKALGYFERGLAIDSEAIDPLAETARSAYLSFDDDKAHAYAQRTLELSPGHPLARAVVANLEGRPTALRWQAGTTTTLAAPLLLGGN